MKQTAVEWLCEQYHLKQDIEIVKQAKEMEKQQQDEFAIEFAEWCLRIRFEPIENPSVKKLLEIYKKEKL